MFSFIPRLLSEREVVLYCDLHGHSRKNNVFMYGCDSKSSTSVNLQERVFPLMMSKNAHDKVEKKEMPEYSHAYAVYLVFS